MWAVNSGAYLKITNMPTKKAEQIANAIIAEMKAAKLSPDQMLQVIKLAKEKFEGRGKIITKI